MPRGHGAPSASASTSTSRAASPSGAGLRSHTGSRGRTKAQLYAEARKKNIRGRSSMNKAELQKAVGRS